VDTLLLSRNFISANPDFADRCVGTAFAQGAEVAELAEDPGQRLDREAEGIAARLRFRIDREEEAAESAA
jgi:peptide subunit release factor 1 (eRF1)